MPARKLEKYLARQFEKRVLEDNLEREQKYRISNVDAIRKRLTRLGAELRRTGFERNELFDLEGRLRKTGHKLRLRRHGKETSMLTLKGPRLNGRQKTRLEIETPVNYEAVKGILELIGFRITDSYSKIREEYKLHGCSVCLDKVPNTGWFIEIEGRATKICEIAAQLGLQRDKKEHRSYRKLIRDAVASYSTGTNCSNDQVVHEVADC